MKVFAGAALGMIVSCAGRTAAEPEVTLRCLTTPLHLRFEGSGPFPDGTILKISIARADESHEAGRLDVRHVDAAGGACETAAGRFSYACAIHRPGTYRATVILLDEYQRERVRQEIAGRFPVRRWRFEFDAWGDDLRSRLEPEREKVEALAAEARRLYDRARTAVESRQAWTDWGPEIRRQARQLENQVTRARWEDLYPAALLELRSAVSWLLWNSEHFFWRPDGSFGGAFDLREGKWARTPSGDLFSFGAMRGSLDQAVEVARREHDLWIVKDARRSGQDMANVEALLRGERRERIGDPEPPPPPPFAELLAARASEERRLAEARKLLDEADRLWNRPGRESFAIYKRLLKDYPAELDRLQVRGRVDRRAGMDED